MKIKSLCHAWCVGGTQKNTGFLAPDAGEEWGEERGPTLGLHRLEVKLRTERRRSLCPGKGGKAPDRASTYGEQFTVHMREEIPT